MVRQFAKPAIGQDPWGITANGALDNLDGRLLNVAYDVKEYGAAGDGSTDDTAAIQSAVDTCKAAGGGTVFFPPGTYKLVTNPIRLFSGTSPSIVPYSNITLKGAGAGSSIIQQTTTGVDVIKGLNDVANGAQAINCGIFDLTVSFGGVATNSGNGIYLAQQADNSPAFQGWQVRNVIASNCQGSGKYGFNFEGVIVTVVADCMALACANGFYFNGARSATSFTSVSTSTSVTSCYANLGANAINGFRCTDNSYMLFQSCAVDYSADSTGSAYLIEGCSGVGLYNCGFELDGTHVLANGFRVAPDANSNTSVNVNITGCRAYQSKSCNEVIVKDNNVAVVDSFVSKSSVGGGGSVGLTVNAGASVVETNSTWSSATKRSIDPAATWLTPGVPRITTGTGNPGTITPAAGTQDVVRFTALSGAVTLAAPTGTPADGQQLVIELTDNGTARAITHNAVYIAGPGGSLATTTVISTMLREVFEFNTGLAKWVRVQ